jgi:hypothetical protein
MQRLRPPQATLGIAHKVQVVVTPGATDTVAGDPERVSARVRGGFAKRVSALGYELCLEAPCDGVLEIALGEVAFGELPPEVETADSLRMKAMMQAALSQAGFTATSSGSGPRLSGRLTARVTLTQADGTVSFRHAFSQQTSAQGKSLQEVAQETIDAVLKSFTDLLERQAPTMRVTLEVGGVLNRGVEMLHQAEWPGAAAHFTELTHSQPELDGAWYDLGVALEAQGDWAPALEAYRAAERLVNKPHYRNAASTAESVLRVSAGN